MDEERESIINKDTLLIGFIVIAVIILIVLLIVPKKEENPSTPTPTEPKNNITLKLFGDNPYHMLKGKTYNEPGYEAYDNGVSVSYKIKKSGTVNASVPGKYELTYEVDGVIARRTVIVSNLEASIIEDSSEYTNENYNIMVLVKGSDYNQTLLPDGNTTKDKAIEYEISQNGTYKFTVTDIYSNKIELEKKASNFDKEGPTGTCTNKLDLGKTYVEVKATDAKTGVAKYGYNNGEKTTTSTNPKYEYNGLYKNVSVILYDKLGNTTTIKCVSSGEGATAQIKPPAGANIVKSAESNTLKVSIEKKSNYYITRVWVLDPYNQINKGLAGWGSKLSTPATIINNDIAKYGYQNKIIVGINGSGFYSMGAWEPSCSASCKNQYNKTSEGGIAIANGTVLRSWYQDSMVDKARNDAVYTISKEGYIDVYPNTNSYSESARKTLFDNIIAKGYRNTWMFRPVIMQNGKIVDSSILGTFLNGGNKRSVVCQIDRNNFVMITSHNHGISDYRTILPGLGCKTAFNLDGGGSIALLFKSKNGSLETIDGGGRSVVDTFYFVEK